MLGLQKNKARAEEIRLALEAAEADSRAARASLGIAVADDNTEAAEAARGEVNRLQELTSELRAALSIVDQRASEAAEREAQEQQREHERWANTSRKKRIAAAAKVDKALAALGRAYTEYVGLPPGGTPENGSVVTRRAKAALALAMAHHALPVARALDVQAVPGAQHRRPLAESEAALIREFDA